MPPRGRPGRSGTRGVDGFRTLDNAHGTPLACWFPRGVVVECYIAPMARIRKYLELDARRRLALGSLARHDIYLAAVAADGVITLTPAEVTPLATPPPVVRRPRARKKAAPAADATPQDQEQQNG